MTNLFFQINSNLNPIKMHPRSLKFLLHNAKPFPCRTSACFVMVIDIRDVLFEVKDDFSCFHYY